MGTVGDELFLALPFSFVSWQTLCFAKQKKWKTVGVVYILLGGMSKSKFERPYANFSFELTWASYLVRSNLCYEVYRTF